MKMVIEYRLLVTFYIVACNPKAGICSAGLLLCLESLLHHLQKTDLTMATDLTTELVLVLHVPCDIK